jgi:hypothetical protein
MMIPLDKDKYLQILRATGVDAALTQLHHDTENWEVETFEGQEGYQPKMFTELNSVREFSRELWAIALREGRN